MNVYGRPFLYMKRKQYDNNILNKIEVYPIVIFLILSSIYIAFNLKQIHVLGVIGHFSVILSILYKGIEYDSFFLLVGHFLLFINSTISIFSKGDKLLEYLKSIIGIISHSFFSFNFIRLIMNKNKIPLGFKKYLYFCMIFANIGFSINYHFNYIKKYSNYSELKKKNYFFYLFTKSLCIFF